MRGEAETSEGGDTNRSKSRRDAERNTRRILQAASAALRDDPQASMADIAEAAGFGVATVYRRFPTRQDLLQGVIWELFAADMAPALVVAANEPDPRKGVSIAFEAALSAASRSGAILPEMTLDIIRSTFADPVSRIIEEGRQQGLFRRDLDPERDTLRLILMLLGVVPTLRPESDGWRRYLRLVMDSLLLDATDPLPPAEVVTDPFQRS